MNDSVDSDALVMPSSTGRPFAGRLALADDPLVLLAEPELVDHVLDEELGVAHVFDLHPPHHLAGDGLDVLVVDGHALEAVDLLDFVDQVLLQFLLAEDRQDVVRIARTVHQRVAGADPFVFLHGHVHAALDFVLGRLGRRVFRHDDDLAAALDDAAELDRAVDGAHHRGVAGLAGLEQFDDARQTAGDVLGLGRLARDLGEDVAGEHLFAVTHHEVRARRHVVAPRRCRRAA